MAEILVIENFPASNISEESSLNADAAAGQAVIIPANLDNFAIDDFVLVGAKGGETSEILRVQSVTGNITFTTNLVQKHFRNEPIYKLRANQSKIYRAANVDGTVPLDTAFASIATVTFQGDQLTQPYTDNSGGSGFWYKYTLYNNVAVTESALADAVAVRGGGYGHYASVDDVRTEAGLKNNRWITDQVIYTKLVSAESEVNGALIIAGYSLPLTSVPDIVANATILIAAGYLLLMDYGPEHSGTNKDGTSKLQQGRAILQQITNTKVQLVDPATKQVLGKNLAISGYPDDSAASATPSEDYMFKITDKF